MLHVFTRGPYLSYNRQYAQGWVLDSIWANQLSPQKCHTGAKKKFMEGFSRRLNGNM